MSNFEDDLFDSILNNRLKKKMLFFTNIASLSQKSNYDHFLTRKDCSLLCLLTVNKFLHKTSNVYKIYKEIYAIYIRDIFN